MGVRPRKRSRITQRPLSRLQPAGRLSSAVEQDKSNSAEIARRPTRKCRGGGGDRYPHIAARPRFAHAAGSQTRAAPSKRLLSGAAVLDIQAAEPWPPKCAIHAANPAHSIWPRAIE